MAQNTILLISASPAEIIGIYAEAIEEAGYHVIASNDGGDAPSLATEHTPALILLDVILPGANGFQTLRQIYKNAALKAIPIVLMDSEMTEINRLWASKLGASGYIQKPETIREFKNVITEFAPSRSLDILAAEHARPSSSPVSNEDLKKIEQELAHFLGPLANTLIKKVSPQAPTVSKLYTVLANFLTNEADRKAFLKRRPG